MQRALLFLFFIFPMAFLMGSEMQGEEESIFLGPPPAWVKQCDFPLEPVPLKPSQVNLQYLLTDTQCNWIEKSHYYHFAIKALTQVGVGHLGQLDIDFSPSYEKVVVHTIRVFRDGVWSDRLQSARYSVLQRESELDSDLYKGVLTLVYFLSDVTEGDIVEFAYSIEGEMPHFSTHLTDGFNLQGSVSFERLYRRLLVSPQTPVNYKLFNCSEEPHVVDLSPGVREWSWELLHTEPYSYDEDSPSWHLPFARVQFSQYGTWKEVIDKMLPIYALPDDLASDPSPDMLAQVEKWMEAAPSSLERAFLALRFVQEKVRYLGFEEGLDGFKPGDPRQVFERRFGDCKDKTFLLHALLQLMDIPSTPVLVHSDKGKNLPDALPFPFGFNHVILRIEIDGEEFWVDSTFYLQGGSSLRENFLPIYYWGLPVSSKETGLVEITGNYQETATLIDTSIVLLSKDLAQMKISTTYRGYKADFMRRNLDSRGKHNFSENVLGFLQKMYGSATAYAPLIISDDREKNVLTMTESYQVPTVKSRGHKVMKVFSSTIRNYLNSGLNPERSSPYAIIYPVWVKEHIHIENGFADWAPDSEEYAWEHEALFYSHSRTIGGQTCDVNFELRHLKDHVPTDALRDYWEITSEIEQDGFFQVSVLGTRKKAA
ncbi:MAG: DUF3857 and transglutaminase domain-containing protein [Verrucomicrobia bacterium]|nr:DUF3857 and transglutaminase domain-containing protein [Verrucomicrobiota bacterium]